MANKYFYENSSIMKTIGVSSIAEPININQNLDAFQRLRVSLPSTQYEYNFQYNDAPSIWDNKITGLATRTHQPAISSVRLITGAVRTTNLYKIVSNILKLF